MVDLLILGGSHCQKNAFIQAKQRHLTTMLFDYLPHPPGAALADHHCQISTFDVESCVAQAVLCQPKAVMTMGTDQPIYTAACITDALKLPSFLDIDTALAVTNKAVMKATFAAHNIPTAPWRVVNKEQLAQFKIQGPLVIKPLDSQGQKGVFRVRDVAEATALFDSSLAYSRTDTLLCEQYYPSKEVTVSAWVASGEVTILTVTDRVTFAQERHIGVCAAHRYPSQHGMGQEDAIAQITKQVTKAFGLRQGPLYLQLLIGADGVLVNEIACRIGGAFEDAFIPFLTGFDILSAVIDGALGRSARPPAPFETGTKSVRVLMPFARSGKLAVLTPLAEILALSYVKEAGYNYQVGDTLPTFEHAGARLGYMVLTAPNSAIMTQQLEEFYHLFQVLDEGGNDLLLRHEI